MGDILRDIIKMIGLISLICFSFFYTETIMDVVNEQDEIMIKINEEKDKYKKEPTNAIITKDTITPGLNGYEVDVEKSYKDMKQVGIFKEMLLSYKQIKVENSLSNIYDKYIVKGNNIKKNVALIFTIKNKNDLNQILSIKDVYLNIFIDYKLLADNLNHLKKDNYFIYTYGDNSNYTTDNLVYANNLINNNFNNKSLYCLTDKKNKNTLNTCKNKKMHTIYPTIITNNHAYNNIKNNITNGSLILLEPNTKTLNEFSQIINFIVSKGYKIVSLDQILSEIY